MRGRKICFFLSIAWLLIICTILSEHIQVLMTVRVEILEPGFSLEDKKEIYSREILSDGHLYEVKEGSEWEKGMKAELVEEVLYTEDEENIQLSSSFNSGVILYRTKALTPGCDVQKTKVSQGKEDSLLILLPEQSPKLVSVMGQNPFMENAQREAMGLPCESRIYSMNDLNAFAKCIPLLGILAAFLLITFITWIIIWHLSSHVSKNKIPLFGNLLILSGILYGICNITEQIKLPSSLLPARQIFDWAHYKNEFAQITEGLKAITTKEAKMHLQIFKQNLWYGLVAMIGIIIAWCVAWVIY